MSNTLTNINGTVIAQDAFEAFKAGLVGVDATGAPTDGADMSTGCDCSPAANTPGGVAGGAT